MFLTPLIQYIFKINSAILTRLGECSTCKRAKQLKSQLMTLQSNVSSGLMLKEEFWLPEAGIRHSRCVWLTRFNSQSDYSYFPVLGHASINSSC